MKTLIIAEAGVNHNGSIDLALRLVDVAVSARADVVKFQTFKAEKLVTKDAERAKYQSDNTGDSDTQFNMLKKLELTESMHSKIISYCQEKGILFLSTPFDEDAADYLEPLVPFWKIPSGEITNFPFLKHLARKNKPIILSSGMSTLEEVRDAINFIKSVWKSEGIEYFQPRLINQSLSLPMLTVLHCTTAYPTPFLESNLRAIQSLHEELGVPVGYSDHTLGIEASVGAVALGSLVIEKHFTLDKTMPGPDHKASLEPDELISLVTSIRNIEVALGQGVKHPTASELQNIKVIRKGMYYKRTMTSGEVVSESDISILRPATKLSPAKYETILNRKLNKSVSAGNEIQITDFE